MAYKIECYVETVSSDGKVTVRGVDGYRLERGDKMYNVLWEDGSLNVKLLPMGDLNSAGSEQHGIFKVSKENFQLLLTAKASRLKVWLEVKDDMSVQKVSLI